MERHERSAFSSPVASKAVRAAFDGGRLTSDAGVLGGKDRKRAQEAGAADCGDGLTVAGLPP